MKRMTLRLQRSVTLFADKNLNNQPTYCDSDCEKRIVTAMQMRGGVTNDNEGEDNGDGDAAITADAATAGRHCCGVIVPSFVV